MIGFGVVLVGRYAGRVALTCELHVSGQPDQGDIVVVVGICLPVLGVGYGMSLSTGTSTARAAQICSCLSLRMSVLQSGEVVVSCSPRRMLTLQERDWV